jgi:endonuclease/exonuclease/phosphatase family metal-dependent hydrolase
VKLSGPTATQAKTLTVLTFNRGENGGTSMQPFKNASKPDVMVLQDATGKSRGYVKSQGYEEFGFGDDIGEFSIVSKFPVTSRELISHQGTPVAARFTLDWEGRSIVIYTLHLPTPRQTLASLKRGAFLWGILPGATAARKQESYESFFHTHFDITRMVIERVEAETLPTLLAGDFNASATGSLHQLATRKLRDAHEVAGQGAGFTFPGTTHNPLSLGRPWMRLDKLMCNDEWQPVSCIAEPDRASQHRAVTASFALTSKR